MSRRGIFALGAACVIAASAQDKPLAGDGQIRGRVSIAATGGAAAGAQISLYLARSRRTRVRQQIQSVDGRFVFADLPADRYVVTVYRIGYEGASKTVTLGPGAARADIELALRKAPVVTGRVVDQDGRPMEGARVRLHRKAFERGHERLIDRQGNGGLTDDRGLYRVYALETGVFVVTVVSPRDPAPANQVTFSHSPQLYPLASRLADARQIRLGLDEVLSDIDFEIEPAFDSTVRFQAVIVREGAPCADCGIRVSEHFGSLSIPVTDGRTSARGDFVVEGLPKGSYTVSGGRSQDDFKPEYIFRENFSITEAGALGIQLETWSAPSVSIELDFTDPPASFIESSDEEARVFVSLDPLEEGVLHSTLNSRNFFGVELGRDKTTAILENSGAGLHRIEFRIRHGGYVKTLRANNRPLREMAVEIPVRGETRLRLEIAFDSATIAGSVRAPEGTAVVVDAFPVLEPSIQQRRATRTHPDGSFRLEGVAPGEYSVFAYPAKSGYEFEDRLIRQRFSGESKRVVVRPNGEYNVQLDLAGE